MDPEQEELAALHALHALDESEQSALEIELARDTELEKLAEELEATAAQLAAIVPAERPPDHLKKAIMAQVHDRIAAKKRKAAAPSPVLRFPLLPWAIAAVLAVGSLLLWTERTQLTRQLKATAAVEEEARQQLITVRDERDVLEEKAAESIKQMAQLTAQVESFRQSNKLSEQQVASLTQQITDLRKKDAFAQMQIATLQGSVDAYKQGVAVVVWDSEKHQGVLKLEKMPPVEAGKDYQLWVVDPKNPTPVDAGVVQVDAQGFAKIDFKPVINVSEAAKFALSIEREGGVPKGEGPIILIGP